MIFRLFSAALFLIFAATPSHAQHSFLIAEPVVTTPSAGLIVRQSIINTISGGGPISPPSPILSDGSCCDANALGYFGREPEFKTWMTWGWGFGGAPLGMYARTYFAAFENSTCLLVYHGGHGQGFFSSSEAFSPVTTRDFIRRAVNELGCDVVLSSMPLTGENAGYMPRVGITNPDNHAIIGTQPQHAPPAGTPLRYFIEPAIGSITYALSRRSYDKIIMAGISGGGWTTTLVAAIDTRITHSYAIAGSVPFANRTNGTSPEGDWEQYEGTRALGIDYHDLYFLGTIDASGTPNRRVGLLYNGLDGCCFKAPPVNDFAPWVVNYARQNGFGPLRVFVDPIKADHLIYPSHQDAIISDATGAGG